MYISLDCLSFGTMLNAKHRDVRDFFTLALPFGSALCLSWQSSERHHVDVDSRLSSNFLIHIYHAIFISLSNECTVLILLKEKFIKNPLLLFSTAENHSFVHFVTALGWFLCKQQVLFFSNTKCTLQTTYSQVSLESNFFLKKKKRSSKGTERIAICKKWRNWKAVKRKQQTIIK